MTPQTELEIKRSFFAHTFAELMAEIRQARLNGSLRISDKDRKCVVYFKGGSVGIFAFSNARASRLFDILLRQNKLSKDDLTQIPNFTNDLELAAFLRDKKFLAKTDSDKLFAEQIEGILVDIFAWETGEWTFSSLARIRDGLAFKVNTTALLVDYGRCLAVDKMLGRFRSLEERFSRPEMLETDVSLTPDEGFVHSRSNDRTLTAAGLVSVAAMSESAALQAIYTLWLGGMLTRNDWQPAFSFGTVAAMKNTRLELKTEARLHDAPEPVIDETSVVAAKAPPKEPEIVITLEEYLERVENAATHYDILGVDIKAEADELKRAYFSMVRMFHPDRYHAKGGETLKRIQHAFTELAQAHETLKNVETREVYDYRMRKELAEREKRLAANKAGEHDVRIEQAEQNFERGFSLLMENEHQDALPHIARAVHFAPKNARYHAYYGKALSSDAKQRHKAESEMQSALKLDPNNPTFRILLAEFFIQFNLLKRAEGELTRLLAVFPSNREARELLESLKT